MTEFLHCESARALRGRREPVEVKLREGLAVGAFVECRENGKCAVGGCSGDAEIIHVDICHTSSLAEIYGNGLMERR